MAVKIYDTMTTASDGFPLAYAEKINVKRQDGSEDNLQNLFNNGELSGGSGGSTATTLTQEEYDALDPQEQLEGEFYCYDSGRHFRNGVEYGKDGVQISDNETVEDKTWSSKKTSDEIDALISDTTSSTASTYSSKKIDEIANGIVIPASTATRYIKFTLRNYTKADVITVADNYGGKIEILGTHDSAYKIPKVIRYSYGDWNTYDATTNQNYKIGGLYQYSTENVYYLEIKSNTTISIQGSAITPEVVTDLPVATSEMTLIPESKYASISDSSTSETSTWSSQKTSDEIAKVDASLGEIEKKIGNIDNLKLINLGENVDADNCRIAYGNINRVYGYCGYFTQNVPMKGYAVIRCYHYGSGIRQFIDYTASTARTYTRFIQYDGKTPTAWQELATMDKIALKQECFNQKVTLTDSNWKYKKIPFTKSYMNTPSVNVSCGDYLNIEFYSYWGCEAHIINLNNKGCTIRYRSSKASKSEPLEVSIIVFVNGI